MRASEFSTRWVGDRHLLVSFAGADHPSELSRQTTSVLEHGGLEHVSDIVGGAASVLVSFNGLGLDPAKVEARVRELVISGNTVSSESGSRLIEIPTCYEGGCSPDLEDLARQAGLSSAEVVRLHSGAEYRVDFLGFMPGFGYLSGLPAALEAPRLESPRLRVPVGSVGIAGARTGVYPMESPGGWRLIGRTPVVMFDALRERPALLAAGDRVRFVPIDFVRFEAMQTGGL